MKPWMYASALVLFGCVGPCADLAGPRPPDLERIVAAMEAVDPAQMPTILAAGAGEVGLGGAGCRPLLEAVANVDPAQRAALIGAGIGDCDVGCPVQRGTPSPATTASALAQACDDAGAPDTVFGGALAPLRAGMEVHEYALHRHLYEALHRALSGPFGDDALWARVERLRPQLAEALDRAAPDAGDAALVTTTPTSDTPAFVGHVDQAALAAVFAARKEALRSCVTTPRPRPPESPTDRAIREHAGLLGALEEHQMDRTFASEAGVSVLFRFTFGPDGSRWWAAVEGLDLSRAQETCLLDTMADVAGTPTPDGGPALVAWPLTLVEPAAAVPEPPPGLPPGEGPRVVPEAERVIRLGALEQDAVVDVVGRALPDLRACYTRALREDPSLSGEVEVKFYVAKDGSVSKADTKRSTLGNPRVERCLNERFLDLRFPEPPGGGIVIISFPLVFVPS